MCDAVTEQLIRSAVDGFVQKGYMFTAFDVTKFLRKSGERIRHSDVNDVVKAMYANTQMGQYARDTKDVGAPIAPFVYYHPYSDLNNYEQHWVDNNPSQTGMKNDSQDDGTSSTATPAPVHTATMPSASYVVSTPAPKDAHVVTDEGRLNIPIRIVQYAGFAPRQIAWVEVSGQSIVICNRLKVTNNVKYPLKVNQDGRIRLCRSILGRISNGSLFKLQQQKDEIVVMAY